MKSNPPFRAEQVGSLVRSAALQRARRAFVDGTLSAAALETVVQEAIEQCVDLQRRVGLQAIGDGGQRGNFAHAEFFARLTGVQSASVEDGTRPPTGIKQRQPMAPRLSIIGKLRRTRGLATADFLFLRNLVGPAHVAKVNLPSPTMLHPHGSREDIDVAIYPELDEFFEDIVTAYREELAELYRLGCRYVHLADTNLAYLCDPLHRARIQALGGAPVTLPRLYARLISACVRDCPPDMTIGLHLGRGNQRAVWAAEGGYEPVAEIMFNECAVDAFLLEYDEAHADDFKALRFVPRDKRVVLGLVNARSPMLESRDQIRRRVEEASQYLAADQCSLSPHCGFASAGDGGDLSVHEQFLKLQLVVEMAAELWPQ